MLFLLTFPLLINAQYFNYGQSRASISWKKIESLNFEVIYPKGFDAKAVDILLMLEGSRDFVTETLNHKPKKVSVLLHTETVKSNAFLGWAPSRIEMFTTPHQGTYSQDWLEQLAIHEYRHMVQLSKIETEMPRLLRVLFGEQAAALITAAYIPFWLIEGDAVSVETGLSHSGRGRFPDFHRPMRAQVIENGMYLYDKAYLGSYKHNVPNYYQLGYYLTAGARMLYEKPVWDEVFTYVAQRPFSLIALNKGLKNSIGLNRTELYDTVFSYLTNKWEKEDLALEPTPYREISTTDNRYYTNYLNGFKLNDSLWVVERTGLSNVSSFITIDSKGNEKVLFKPGVYFRHSVSHSGQFLVWSERLPHIRWEHADRSLLRILNTDTKKMKQFTFNEKLFAPALSPNFKQIVAVEADNYYNFNLVLIDAENGLVKQVIENPKNDYLITPSWSSDGKSILVVLLRDNQKSIARICTQTFESEILIPFANQEILRPQEFENGILFIGGYRGIDNLYFYNLDENQIYEVISSRFGIDNYSVKQNEIVYSNYSAKGYRLVGSEIDISNLNKVDIQEIEKKYTLAQAISEQEPGVIEFKTESDIDYLPVKYPKSKGLFNFHSWAPVSIDPYRQEIYPGVSIMSQNISGAAEFTAGYRYFKQFNRGEVYARFKYMGLYPVFDIETNRGKRQSSYLQINNYLNNNNEIIRTDTTQVDFNWAETNLSIGSNVPFVFSKGQYFSLLKPRARYQITNLGLSDNAPGTFPSGSYGIIDGGVYFHHIKRTSPQQLQSSFGLVLDAAYVQSLHGVTSFGSMVTFTGILYLPSVFRNHGITVYNGFQQKESGNYTFSDRIRYPRGHSAVSNNMLYTFQAGYQLPLCYPDLSIWRIAYIKRLRLNLFYDFSVFNRLVQTAQSSIHQYSGSLQSTGIELKSDMHFLRLIAPFELGFRSSYLFNGNFSNEFLIADDFNL